MTAFMLKVKSLENLLTRLVKVPTLNMSETFQRNIDVKYRLLSDFTGKKQFIIHNLRDSAQVTDNTDFGKVIDLDDDFEELKVNEVNESVKSMQKKIRKKNKKVMQQSEKKNQINEEKKITLLEKKDGIQLESAVALEPDKAEFVSEENEFAKQRFKLSKDKGTIFRKIMTELKQKKIRNKEGKIILEGKRLIHSAISKGHIPLNIFFSRFSDIRILNLPEGVQVTQVPYKALNIWGDVVTSQGVIGIFKMPKLENIKVGEEVIPLTVLCDNVRDPGNLGTILRILTAVGCQELILTTGCVDIWEQKVLRAGAGAHFHLPIVNNVSWSDIETKVSLEAQIVLADNKIVESTDKSQIKRNFFSNPRELADSLPLHCYSSFKYNSNGVVIVLGGETQGLSEEAYQFAINRNGSRVFIPMCKGTESLNSAISIGILSYEFKRQLNFISNMNFSEETISNVGKH